jgi:hypothetical protein
MKNKGNDKPFIPRKAPKSFVVAIVAGLVSLFFGGPLMFGAYFLSMKTLLVFGQLTSTLQKNHLDRPGGNTGPASRALERNL